MEQGGTCMWFSSLSTVSRACCKFYANLCTFWTWVRAMQEIRHAGDELCRAMHMYSTIDHIDIPHGACVLYDGSMEVLGSIGFHAG